MIKYNFRNFTDEDYEFVYELKKCAYKKYVELNWGVWDEIAQREYFKKFIETVEKHRLEILAKQNPDYIHQITPFAYALGIDGIWMEKISQLSNIIKPDWYDAEYSSDSLVGLRNLADIISNSAKNSYSSSSSGGSCGGGGCSGGGSGGGGGGSW